MTDPNTLITVLVPVSPIPSHPSTAVVDDTLDSVRSYLPTAPIVVTADGVRPEQEDREHDYELFLSGLDTRWGDQITLVSHRHHQHQARMTRRALVEEVATPLILFVEGDCTLWGRIDLPSVCDTLLADTARVVRFHHEASVLAEHEWLNVNGGRIENHGGVPLISTVQWSQRPHVARADYYRWLLGPRHFHPDSRTMIEDVVHSTVQTDWMDRGRTGWDMHRLHLYAAADQNGSLKHSETADGRGPDPKYPMNLMSVPGGPTYDEWKAEQP